MTLDATARIQAASGTVTTPATSCTPALPNPAADGSTLILYVGTTGGNTPQFPVIDPPWQQDAASASRLYVWRRDDQPAGETSWSVTSLSPAVWAWRVEEWAGLSTIGQPDAVSSITITIGTQANPTGSCTADVDDFAALAAWWASAGTGVFPAGRTYPAGWSETDYLAVGTGTGASDFAVAFAESYPGASGSVSSTLTWDITGGGTYTDKTVHGVVACYQPAAAAPPSPVVLAG